MKEAMISIAIGLVAFILVVLCLPPGPPPEWKCIGGVLYEKEHGAWVILDRAFGQTKCVVDSPDPKSQGGS